MSFGWRYWLVNLVLLLVIYGLNFFAWRYFWYWRFSHYGFDKLMHFLSGLFIGLIVMGLWYWWRKRRGLTFNQGNLIVWISLAIFVIGGGWEFLERGARHNQAFYWIKPFADLTTSWLDSLTDFISDLLGAGLSILSFKLWNKTKN